MLFKFLQDILYRKSGKLLTSYDDEVEFVPFLIQRWLSMHSKNTVKILNDTTNQLYSVFETKDQWYKMFLCLIPKTYFKKIKYIKKNKDRNLQDLQKEQLVDFLAKTKQISKREVRLYLDSGMVNTKQIERVLKYE